MSTTYEQFLVRSPWPCCGFCVDQTFVQRAFTLPGTWRCGSDANAASGAGSRRQRSARRHGGAYSALHSAPPRGPAHTEELVVGPAGFLSPCAHAVACRWLHACSLFAPLRSSAQVSCEDLRGDLRGSAHKKLLQFKFQCDLYKGHEPADLTDLIDRRQRRSDMYLNQPWLVYVSAVLKYGPARQQLEVEADKLGMARPTSVSASTVHALLVRTARALQGADMDLWVLNCGRVRQSGYLAWFLKWGVVQQLSGDSRGSAELCCLGQGRKVYAVADKCSPELRTLCNSMLSLSVAIRTCQRRPSAPWC